MATLSPKYIAGFLDADGSIQLMWRPVDRVDSNPEVRRAYLSIEFGQKTDQDEVLYRIQAAIGGKITHPERQGQPPVTILKVWGKQALMAMSRIRKHLVIKRHYANVVMDMHGKAFNVSEARVHMKEQRKMKSLPLPNFPPRQWLAGYFDGDGTISVRIGSGRTSAQPTAEIVASGYDSEGVEIIHKVFGGSLKASKERSHLVKWTLTMPPSKAKEFLGYFAKHLIAKKEQAYVILGCAEMGHYRDGKNIKSAIKQLKAHPHRLNETRPDVPSILKTIEDIQFKDTYKGRNFWPEGRSKEHLVKR